MVERLRTFRSSFDTDKRYIWRIPDETKVIGVSGLHKRGGSDELEIGYWINLEFNQQGLATEIAGVLTRLWI